MIAAAFIAQNIIEIYDKLFKERSNNMRRRNNLRRSVDISLPKVAVPVDAQLLLPVSKIQYACIIFTGIPTCDLMVSVNFWISILDCASERDDC